MSDRVPDPHEDHVPDPHEDLGIEGGRNRLWNERGMRGRARKFFDWLKEGAPKGR